MLIKLRDKIIQSKDGGVYGVGFKETEESNTEIMLEVMDNGVNRPMTYHTGVVVKGVLSEKDEKDAEELVSRAYGSSSTWDLYSALANMFHKRRTRENL